MLLQATPADDLSFGTEWAVAAYVVIFAALFGYLLRLHLANSALRRRVEELEKWLRESGARQP